MNQKSALVRWTLTRHFLASFSSAMNDRACIISTSNTSNEEMKQTALKRDEEQVQAKVNHLNETMTDPFDIGPVMISPDLHFRDVLAFMCSNVFNFD
jgi:hypothetical protein